MRITALPKGRAFFMSTLASQIIGEKQTSFDNLKVKRLLWDNAEKLFHNQLNDLVSEGANAQVFDPKLSTLTIERAYRVMAQLPMGKVKGLSTTDVGDAKLKNLLLERYVIPNANSQFDFLTKLRMVDIYSNLYGNFFVLIDQDVKPNGYVGPDMWMLNIRDVFPQNGAVSLDDSDQVIVRTWRPITFFEGLAKHQGYKNIPKIIEKLKLSSGSKQNRSPNDLSKREENQYPYRNQPIAHKGFFEVLTRYERDRWVDVCVDADLEFRDQKNPHDNGELPVENKYSIPLLDDFMGMGDMERGGSMQMVINASWNLYLDALKMSIFPPMIVNKDNVASFSSLKPIPGAMWLGRNNVTNVATPVNLSPKGVETFNNTYQVANAAIQGLFGQSETNIGTNVDPAMGKTPTALQMQAQRENTRDNADKFYMEQFIKRSMKKMLNLMTKKQQTAVSFRMFPEEIDLIAKDYPEIQNLYNNKTGKLTVKKSKDSSLYDWEMITGSTAAVDNQTQQQNLQMLLDMYLKSNMPPFGNLLEKQLEADGYKLNFSELFKRIVANSGIDSWEKILEDMSVAEQGDNIMQNHAQQFHGVLQKIAQTTGAQINAVPPMPQQPSPMSQLPPQGDNMPHGPINWKGLLAERVNINYKDLPPDIQRQAESDAGFTPSQYTQAPDPNAPVRMTDPHNAQWVPQQTTPFGPNPMMGQPQVPQQVPPVIRKRNP